MMTVLISVRLSESRKSMKPIYLNLEAVAGAVALSEAQIQKLVREGTFPKPRLLSSRRVGWLVREVEE
ncbi:prophage CP4-57 regulatory family protein [Paraburkholderia fungorum]|uniref:Prophage CP4-57 regulatory family protein n=1 Tax=Paraburkholderia fungorum TaxID=134537 RepID=A0AAU8T4H8_9BURK|nr:AlpA family phage regulatory protein [Paraburkholderia fungorum]AJZ58657.1 prophage CP4-57 regulatory family protein [Paraburkholderia fungorum]